METLGLSDIIGPIMIGPSSSHTAGALRIASMARSLCVSKPKSVEFVLLGSFAHTLCGHGTDKALVAGMLGMSADDLRIRHSHRLAKREGLAFSFSTMPDAPYDHPNTIDIRIEESDGTRMDVRGESVGGGAALVSRLDGIDVRITGESTNIVVRQRDEQGVLAHVTRCISEQNVNIAKARMFRERRGDLAYTVLETDQCVGGETKDAIEAHPAVLDVRIIPGEVRPGAEAQDAADPEAAQRRFDELDFPSAEAMLAFCEAQGLSLSQAFLKRERELAGLLGRADCSLDYLAEALKVMKRAALGPTSEVLLSMGGLIGGEARKLTALGDRGESLCDDQLACAVACSMAALETNAAMGRIVAAPTAGSSGVLPGVLLALQRTRGYSDEQLVRGLACAAAIGYLVTRNATVSGAEGGCQAEVGSAAAMAAAAAAELAGGSPAQCLDAASSAITNLMGLVCDPIAGLVEEPCQKRNAAGAAVALVSAQIALAGVGNLVGFDETVEAMRKVGRSLPFELRESALGGIAAAPSASCWRPKCSGC